MRDTEEVKKLNRKLSKNYAHSSLHFPAQTCKEPLSNRPLLAAAARARSVSFAALKNAASDDNEDAAAAPSKASPIRKRKRKVPLPAELLQENDDKDNDGAVASSAISPSLSSPPPSSTPQQTGGREVDLQERLQQDIARFRKKEVEAKVSDGQLTGFSAFADKAGGILNKVLVADFFVILAFFGWFVTGVFFKSVLSDASVIDKFTDIWMPVIQPALGLLMAGTLGVGALNNVAARTQEANERKGMDERRKNG